MQQFPFPIIIPMSLFSSFPLAYQQSSRRSLTILVWEFAFLSRVWVDGHETYAKEIKFYQVWRVEFADQIILTCPFHSALSLKVIRDVWRIHILDLSLFGLPTYYRRRRIYIRCHSSRTNLQFLRELPSSDIFWRRSLAVTLRLLHL